MPTMALGGSGVDKEGRAEQPRVASGLWMVGGLSECSKEVD